MSYENVTMADLKRALAAHVSALDAIGVAYDGHLGITEGSKLYGRAFRLYRTGYLVTTERGTERTTGHGRPPVGDDYLGMTKREAYNALTARTGVIYDLHALGVHK